MGRKKRLNRFITKWIKSDLPDDRSPVLLLGVTRIPTTPTAARRPCSLPLGTITPSSNPVSTHHHHPKSQRNSITSRKSVCGVVRRNSSGSRRRRDNSGSLKNLEASPDSCGSDQKCSVSGGSDELTPSNLNSSSDYTSPGPMMDRSVDSIGACSLDVDASVDLSDWSEQSSVGTLRSASLPTPEPQPHLPSYLSLACTVSGYSTTTNYDPERLARSRDASPHRLCDELKNTPTYSVRNNLLSPPNVVPLPHHKYTATFASEAGKSKAMEEQILTRHEFYSSSTTKSTFMSKESKSFVSSMFGADAVDACMKNGHQNGVESKCVSFESKNTSYITNGSSKTELKTSYKEFLNGVENKSFIQQRVERLYGPGALAQGFFISKRQKNRSSESDTENTPPKTNEKHSKSMNDKLLREEASENGMKQSTSSPTLPVLRHLRPEFRAQLPIISPKKGNEPAITKSITVPAFKDESKVNGHGKIGLEKDGTQLNGNQNVIVNDQVAGERSAKDGHYFLKILEKETQRLLVLANQVEKELETNELSEEIKGKLRAASGKARLLASQKMQQFRGLCTNNITQNEGEAFPTTNEDLQGFWDMVMLQVEQVDNLFKEIEELKANGWKEIKRDVCDKSNSNGNANKGRRINRPKLSTNAGNEEQRKQREAQRKQMIEARRKAMREKAQTKTQDNIEIYVPESS